MLYGDADEECHMFYRRLSVEISNNAGAWSYQIKPEASA